MTNNIFQKQKQSKLFKLIMNRKHLLSQYIDYYSGNQMYYLKKTINLCNTDELNRSLLLKRANIKNLTKYIMLTISILFQSGYNVGIKTLDTKNNRSVLLQLKLKKYGFGQMLHSLNVYTNLLFDTHVTCIYDTERDLIMFDVITPLVTFVLQDLNYPTKAKQIAYIINLSLSTANGSTINTVRVWNNLLTYTAYIDYDGTFVPLTLGLLNYFGYIPLIHITNGYRMNEYFSQLKQIVILRNKRLNLVWTLFLAAISLQSLSTMVVTGLLLLNLIPAGLTAVIYAKQLKGFSDDVLTDVKWINPDTPLESLNTIQKDIAIQTALEYNINADTFESVSNATSGYQVKLNMQQLINRNKNDIPLYLPQLKKLIQTMMIMLNAYSLDKIIWTQLLIDNVYFTINIPQVLLSKSLQLDYYMKLIAIGINSPVRILMNTKGMTRLQAIELYKKIMLLNQLTNKVEMLSTNLLTILGT